MSGEKPKMYGELAGWWQLISPTEDYADEAAFFAALFRKEGVKTLLELGSRGGNIAWFLKRDFTLTLSDLSGEMLSESEKQNPELEHIRGDMRTLRLGRTFDGVFVHDAIDYMTTEERPARRAPDGPRTLQTWRRRGLRAGLRRRDLSARNEA